MNFKKIRANFVTEKFIVGFETKKQAENNELDDSYFSHFLFLLVSLATFSTSNYKMAGDNDHHVVYSLDVPFYLSLSLVRCVRHLYLSHSLNICVQYSNLTRYASFS